MFGFEKDENDASSFKKFGALTVRYIPAGEKNPFPFIIGFETEFFKNHLPIKAIARLIEPFTKYFGVFNKYLFYLMTLSLFLFAYTVVTSKPNPEPVDMGIFIFIPISFFIALLISLITHEAAHAAIAEKYYQKYYGKSALASVGYGIFTVFPIAALFTGLVLGWNSSATINFVVLSLFSGAYVRLINEKKYYDPLANAEKIEILMAGVFVNFLLGLIFFVPFIAYYWLFGFHVFSQVFMFLFGMSIMNMGLVILNIIPLFGTDGYQASMLYAEKSKNLDTVITLGSLALVGAAAYTIAIMWKWI